MVHHWYQDIGDTGEQFIAGVKLTREYLREFSKKF
jgi:hypothetical protein